ncbi:MAG: diguanylate cyclase [Campylobacterota bacterium]|nr:diguanylate cyclase [Campylobacterota bacterium]
MENKTILIIDDTTTNLDILVELLDAYDVIDAISGKDALEIVGEEKIDLILLDIMMPEMDGYEVCRRIKENKKTKDIPVIFITAKTDEDSIEKAFNVGGIDYVSKPFKPKELLARVKTHLEFRILIENLEFLSSHDTMTGIYNRRKFFELAIQKFNNEKENLYAVMIDIDKFKDINDSYGHDIGDKVIKLLATTIKDNISESSVFGRLGGEEFGLICNSQSIDTVKQSIESLRELIESQEILSEENKPIGYTISSGISKMSSEIKNIDQLLKKADVALYEAKGTGRNKVIFR